jgi:hypothetical protein
MMADDNPTQAAGALDKFAMARDQGHDWLDIHSYLNAGRDAAEAQGYTPQEVDRYIGWKNPGAVTSRITSDWAQATQPPSAEDFRNHYADAVLNQTSMAKNPQAYLDTYATMLGGNKIEGGTAMPSPETLTDTALGLVERTRENMGQRVAQMRSTLMSAWARTGAPVEELAEKGWVDLAQTPDAVRRISAGLVDALGNEVGGGIGDKLEKALRTYANWWGQGGLTTMLGMKPSPVKGEAAPGFSPTLAEEEQKGGMAAEVALGFGTDAGAVAKQLLGDERGAIKLFSHPAKSLLAAPVGDEVKAAVDDLLARSQDVPRMPTADDAHQGYLALMRRGVANQRMMERASVTFDPAQMTKEFQAKAYDEWETGLVHSEPKLSPEVQKFLGGVGTGAEPAPEPGHPVARALQAADDALYRRIVEMGGNETAEHLGLTDAVHAGYVKRIRTDVGRLFNVLDPEAGRIDPIAGEPSGANLSLQANSLKERGMYVLQDQAGNRAVQAGRIQDQGLTYGQQFQWGNRPQTLARMQAQGLSGNTFTVRQPTTMEIEQATAGSENPLTFHHNWIASKMDGVLEKMRVLENMTYLTGLKDHLAEAGLLWHPNGIGHNALGATIPEGFEAVPQGVPILNGHYIPARMAEVLRDIYRQGPTTDLGKAYGAVNSFLTRAMFMTPLPHGMNVATQYAINRGAEWASIPAYARMGRSIIRAVRAVNDPYSADMMQALREGTPLMSGGNVDFVRTMMKNVFGQLLHEEPTWAPWAQKLGFDHVGDMVKGLYNASHDEVWRINDMFMLARKFELEDRGFSTAEAIRLAKQDIPSYEVSPRLLADNKFGRVVSEAMQDPRKVMFGRYHTNMIQSLMSPYLDMGKAFAKNDMALTKRSASRIFGQILMGAAFSTMGIAGAKLTGDPNFMPTFHGALSLPEAVYRMTTGQKSWVDTVGTAVSMPPALQALLAAGTGQNRYGADIFNWDRGIEGNGAALAEEGAHTVYPLGLALDLAQGQGWNALGSVTGAGHVPSPGALRYQAMQRRYGMRDAARQNQHDQLMQSMTKAWNWLHGGPELQRAQDPVPEK